MPISNAYMKTMLKTVYLSGMDNLKYQNSPILSSIGKESWGGGKEIAYAAQYGNGGNFGSVYNTIANNPTTGAANLEWKATQGYTFGLFNINQPEILTTAEERGAYMKALSNKMAACFDGLSKTLAIYLYGGKFGVIDTVVTAPSEALAASGNTMKIHASGSIKMDVGTRFQFMKGSVPNASNLGTAVCTVTNIEDETITFNASVAGEEVANGDQIILYTAVGSDGTPRGIEGLSEIIPCYGNRTGEAWESYISSTFRNVDRSKNVGRLAGQFVLGAANGDTKMTDAMVSLLKKTKRAGGLNNLMIINDETWDAIGAELGIQRNLWQATEGGVTKKQGVTAGINELATAFGDAFIGRTVIDPYCTEGLVYSLEKDDLKFYDLGNISRVIDSVANDQMGKHELGSVGDQGFGDSFGSNVNIDKLFTVEQGQAGEYGPEFRIAANIYGNYILRKTASTGVAVLR